MALKLPEFIKIDNINYTVKVVKDLKSDDKKLKLLGCVSYIDSIINIDDKSSVDTAINTLAHEIVHAIFYERGIEDLISKDVLLEKIVDEVSKGLVQIIRDNPELIKLITKKR